MSLLIDNDVTDLPDPDSPTIPKTSPLNISKYRSLTAFTVPASVLKKFSNSLV